MKLRTIKYYFTEGFKSVFKNGVMSMASIATVAACICILIFSFALAVNVDFALEQLEKIVGVTAIIDDNISEDEVSALYDRISQMEHVSGVHFVSSEEGLERYREETNDTSGILIGIKLPRVFAISTDSASDQAYVIDELERMVLRNEGLTKINHAQKTISVFVAINNGVRIISSIIVLSLCVLSVVIIVNSIMLTVNNRKNEINVMKYVGATDWFIRWPFIIEGMIIGALGAAIPILLFFFGYNEVIALIYESFSIIGDVFEFTPRDRILFITAPAAIVIGLVIGSLGSVLSVRKYLKV